jgi:hypothetical protein
MKSVYFALFLVFGSVTIQLQSFAVFPVGKLFSFSKNVLGINKSQNRLWNGVTDDSASCDLWIVGGGTLGESIGLEFRVKYPSSKIICETLTPSRHSHLLSNGFDVRLRAERNNKILGNANKLVICIPPSSEYQGHNYVAEINEAVSLWKSHQQKVESCADRAADSRQLLLISSVGVYGEFKDIQVVDENSGVDRESSRLMRSVVT